MTTSVAILIPTKDRPDFVIRQLKYYNLAKSSHPVYIGDASNKENNLYLKKYIDTNKFSFKVELHWFPDLNDRKTQVRLGNIASEDYSCCNGDDDFLIPESLTKCADFLKNHSDYRTAHGHALLTQLDRSGPYGNIVSSRPYWQPSIHRVDFDTAVERLRYFVDHYWVPHFSVHRRVEFLRDMKNNDRLADRAFGEILSGFMFICGGKAKWIDCLYLIRSIHAKRDKSVSLKELFDRSPTAHESLGIFRDTLSEFVSEVDDLTFSRSTSIVDSLWESYFERSLRTRYFTPSRLASVSWSMLTKVPWLRSFKVLGYKLFLGQDAVNHMVLMCKQHPWHRSFKLLNDLVREGG